MRTAISFQLSALDSKGKQSNILGLTKKCSFVGAGLAPALTEPQDLIINFEGNEETKPFPVHPGRGKPRP